MTINASIHCYSNMRSSHSGIKVNSFMPRKMAVYLSVKMQWMKEGRLSWFQLG